MCMILNLENLGVLPKNSVVDWLWVLYFNTHKFINMCSIFSLITLYYKIINKTNYFTNYLYPSTKTQNVKNIFNFSLIIPMVVAKLGAAVKWLTHPGQSDQ
jgi:hypothetical protein